MSVRAMPLPIEPVPPLTDGERLTRAEFERRWEAMPELKQAELLEGVVYMPSPVSARGHAIPHICLSHWIRSYELATPGVFAASDPSVRMDAANMPQPDITLGIEGGQVRFGEGDILEGAPELVVEVAASSVSYDLHVKRDIYFRHGVQEYLVWRVRDRAVDWLVRREHGYEPLAPGEDGLLRSEVFPGLWLDPAALLAGDGPALVAALQRGLASPEHAEFVARLAAAQPEPAARRDDG